MKENLSTQFDKRGAEKPLLRLALVCGLLASLQAAAYTAPMKPGLAVIVR